MHPGETVSAHQTLGLFDRPEDDEPEVPLIYLAMPLSHLKDRANRDRPQRRPDAVEAQGQVCTYRSFRKGIPVCWCRLGWVTVSGSRCTSERVLTGWPMRCRSVSGSCEQWGAG
jgi:hypothetical protein